MNRGGLVGVLVVVTLGAGEAGAAVRATVTQYKSGEKTVRVECCAPTARGKHPAVVLLHGAGGPGTSAQPVFRDLARGLAARGYVVLFPHYFDATGHVAGRRFGDADYQAFREAVKDAVDYAASRPDVDPDRLGLFGFSLGSSLAFWQATRDRRVKAVVSCSGPWKAPAKLPPTLILHGADDAGFPVARLKGLEEQLQAEGTPYEVHIYPDTGHNLDPQSFLDAGRRAAAFFDKHVKAADAAQPERRAKTRGAG